MEEAEKGENRKMCLLLDAIEEEGIEKGFNKGFGKGVKKGRAEGKAEEKEANIERLAMCYMNIDTLLSKEKALEMARAILG